MPNEVGISLSVNAVRRRDSSARSVPRNDWLLKSSELTKLKLTLTH
jgi:hypothetical protein